MLIFFNPFCFAYMILGIVSALVSIISFKITTSIIFSGLKRDFFGLLKIFFYNIINLSYLILELALDLGGLNYG